MWAVGVGLIVLIADLVTKAWVQKTAWLQYYPVIDGFFTIQYATNSGIAFGWFDEVESSLKTPILGLMALLAITLVLYYIWTTPVRERFLLLSLGLLLGGILGNLIDRLLHGAVVDFIKVHWGTKFVWPTFNLADSAITTGVVVILLYSFLTPTAEEEPQKEAPSP